MAAASSTPMSADIPLDNAAGRSPSWLDSAHLARGIALAFALAAALIGARLDGMFVHQWLLTIGLPLLLVLATVVLVMLQNRLPSQRSMGTWLLWTLGGVAVALLAAGAVALLATAAALQRTGGDALAAALAAALAWAGAVALNGREAARAFQWARRLAQIRTTLFGLVAAGCTVLAAAAVADKLGLRAGLALADTPVEALAPGIGIVAGLLVALALAAVALRMPRQLAQWQFEGRISASSAGEVMWFAALLPLLMPLALPQAWPPGFGAEAWVSAELWGNVALRAIGVAVAHGVVRLWLGGAGSSAPVPLLLLVPPGTMNARLRQAMATLPLAWRGGPVIRLMVPAEAVAHAGAHLRLAATLGADERLFPRTAQDVAAWHQQVPAGRRWRALPAQEIYAEPARFGDVLRTLVDAQTWVLCVDDRRTAPHEREAWMDALPPGRTVRLDFSGTGADIQATPEQTVWRSRPIWVDGLGPPLPQWLRGRMQPVATRRIAIVHESDDAALAQAIVAALDGRHDAQGRPVQAWAMPQHLGSLRQLPLNGFCTTLASAAVQEVPWPAGLWRLVARLAGTSSGPDAGHFELGWLLGASGAAAAGPAPLMAALARAAVRRIALRQDAAVEPPPGLDGQIDAAAAASSPADQAAWFAQRLLREEWVGLAPPAAPNKPTPAPAPQPPPEPPPTTPPVATMSEAATARSVDTGRPLVFISFHPASNSRAIAHALAQQLRATMPSGVDLFVADELPEGEPVAGGIPIALQLCTHFVPLLCNEYWTRSKACREELFTAVAAFEQTGHPKLLPVLVDRVDNELFELGLPRQMGELRSARPTLNSLTELAFAGPLDESGQPVPMDRHAGEKRSAQIEQVAQRIREALQQPAPSVPSEAEAAAAAPSSGQAEAGVFDFGQAVRSLARLDDSRLAVGLLDGRIAIWPPDGDAPPQMLSPPTAHGPVKALCTLPASLGVGFVSSGTAGRVVLWSATSSGFEPRVIGLHESAVKAMCIAHHEGMWAVAGDEQGRISWWPLEPGAVQPRHHEPLNMPVQALASAGHHVFVALGRGGLQTLQWGEIAPLPVAPTSGYQAHAVATGGDNLYFGGEDDAGCGRIQRIKLRSEGLDPRVLSGMPGIVTTIAVLPDDRVAAGLADGSVCTWDPSAGANMLWSEPPHEGAVLALAVWADGRLCSAGLDGRVVMRAPPLR